MFTEGFDISIIYSEKYLISTTATAVAVLLLAIIFSLLKRNKALQKRAAIQDCLQKPWPSEAGLDMQLNSILEAVISAIRTDGYYFYIFNYQAGHYTLRISRHHHFDYEVMGANYAGLAPYKGGMYSPPLGLAGPIRERSVQVTQDNDVSMLELGVEGGAGLIRVGPVKSVGKAALKNLEELSYKIGPVLNLVLELDRLKSDIETIKKTNAVISELKQAVFKIDRVTKNILIVLSRILETGGCVLLKKKQKHWEIPLCTRIAGETENQFRQDQEALDILFKLVEKRSLCLITPDTKEFFAMPYYLLALGIQALLITRIESRRFKGMAIFWYNEIPHFPKSRESLLEIMAKRVGEIWDEQENYQYLSQSYIKTLKTFIETTDNLQPHTVGHSELIVRYAVSIARQMGLEPEEIENIKLAAYFHDIGMISIKERFVNKQGRFSQLEYEAVKIHPEVGAVIIESTIANEYIASYVRYHHERWDGLGYPEGLQGNRIPLGARIISVADFFTAKIQGRPYREPVNFEQAISDLQAASGAQLDPQVVDILLSWFAKKQSNPLLAGRSLGLCWEMRCCPAHIRSNCPASTQKNKNCWEIEGVNCAAHGDRCPTCMVRTEVIYREKKYGCLLQNINAC